MVRLLPLPWVCQTTPALRSASRVSAGQRAHRAQRLRHRLVGGEILVILGHLLDKLIAVDLVEREVADEVQKAGGVKDATQQRLQAGAALLQVLAIDAAPALEPLEAGRECAQAGVDAVGHHQAAL